MHLWPSMRIRDSFKIAYLKKLEWNLHRMNSEKKRSQQATTSQDKLLDNNDNIQQENGSVAEGTSSFKNSCLGKSAIVCREVVMILTCCYCCFCCGACVDEDEH